MLGGLVVAVAVLGATQPALAKSRPRSHAASRVVVLHAQFHRIRGSATLTDDQYAFVSGASFDGSNGQLIDQRTGRRTAVTGAPGCLPEGLGGSSLVYACGQPQMTTFERYDIVSGQLASLVTPEGLQCPTGVAGVGADWFAFAGNCGFEHVPTSLVFENVQTKAAQADPRTATAGVDLNSPALAQKICPPLMLPTSGAGTGGWGSIEFVAKYAIVAGSGGVYLERCGSRLHEFLTFSTNLQACSIGGCAPPSNNHVVIWQQAIDVLGGIFLPGRRRFTIRVPRQAEPGANGPYVNGDGVTLAITSSSIYLASGNQVWTPPIPPPPSSKKR